MSHLASAKVKVGKNPAGIARNAIDQEENKIHVANRDSKTIPIVDGNRPLKLINTLKFIKHPHGSHQTVLQFNR